MESTIFTTGFVLVVIFMSTESSPVSLLMPRSCSGQPYCIEKHTNYPQKRIDELLSQFKVSLGHAYEINVGRDGFDLADQNDCDKKITYSQIYEIEDVTGAVRAVVQGKNFAQQIRIEYCLSPGPVKNTGHFRNVAEYHNITCRSESMAYNFLVLSLDGKKFESVRSKDIPVNCACRLNLDK